MRLSPVMQVGAPVVIRRPDKNSPTTLTSPCQVPLIKVRSFARVEEEVRFCADEFVAFIAGGLQPEDLMAIVIDDRVAQSYLSKLAAALAQRGIRSNNIIADRYSETPFTIEGKSTLSTVYRAKGNEAAGRRGSFEGAPKATCLDLKFAEVIQASQTVHAFTAAERRALHLGRNMQSIEKPPDLRSGANEGRTGDADSCCLLDRVAL